MLGREWKTALLPPCSAPSVLPPRQELPQPEGRWGLLTLLPQGIKQLGSSSRRMDSPRSVFSWFWILGF